MSSIQPSSVEKQIHEIKPITQKKSLFQKIIRKIVEIAQAVWKLIAFWQKPRSELTDRELELINAFSQGTETDTETPTQSSNATDSDVTDPSTGNALTGKKIHPLQKKIFDESVENIRTFSQKTADKAVEIVYETKVAPILEKVQKATENIPDGDLEFLTKSVLQFGDKVTSFFFDKFDYKENGNASFIQALNWLIKRDEGDESAFKEDLQSKLNERLKNKDSLLNPEDKKIEEYTQPIIEWLINSEHSQMLADLIEKNKLEPEFFDLAFREALSLLIENKLNHYIKSLKANLATEFPEIIKEMMQINADKIASILSGRFGELVENAEYSKIFDQIKQLTANQIDDYVAGAKIHDGLMDKVQSEDAGVYKKIIENHGEELALATSFCLSYKERIKRENEKNPLNQKNENPRLYEIIKEGDSKDHRNIEKNRLYAKLAKKVYKLMLPKEGLVDEVEFLWEHVETTERFDSLIKDAEEIVEGVFPDDMEPLVKQMKVPVLTLSRSFFVGLAKKEIKSAITKAIQTMFSKVADSAYLDEIIAENTFPTLNENLLSSLTEIVLKKKIEKFAPLFKELTEATDTDKNEIREKVRKLLFKKVNKAAQKTIIDEAIFEREALRTISRIENFLENVSESLKTTKKLQATISEFLDGDKGIESDPIYGEMAMKLLFEVGEFEMDGYLANTIVQWFRGTIKNKIAHSFTRSMEPFRKNHQKILDQALGALKKNYSTKEQIRDLLFAEPKEPKNVEQQLKDEMEKTSTIFHDIVYNSLEEIPLVGGIAKSYTPSVGKFDKLIGRIYHNLLGNSYINKHLLIEVQEVVLKELKNSAKKINETPLSDIPIKQVA